MGIIVSEKLQWTGQTDNSANGFMLSAEDIGFYKNDGTFYSLDNTNPLKMQSLITYIANVGATKMTKPSGGSAGQFLKLGNNGALEWATVSTGIGAETDPIFAASPAKNITSGNITNWNNAYSLVNSKYESWDIAYSGLTSISSELGNKIDMPTGGTVGQFLKLGANGSVSWATVSTGTGGITSESDPIFAASAASGIKSSDITKWNSKIDMPSGGSTGNVLKKTSTGVEWGTVSSGGSTVSISRNYTSGTQIATITIDGNQTELYAPQAGQSAQQIQVDWNETNTNSVKYIVNKPTNLSQFTNDENFLTEETAFNSSPAKNITSTNISNWNNKIDMPTGGSTGNVLKKTSNGVEWGTISSGDTVSVSAANIENGTTIATITVNDTTHTIKAPTSGASTGEFNTIETISVNGTNIPVNSENVNIKLKTINGTSILDTSSGDSVGNISLNNFISKPSESIGGNGKAVYWSSTNEQFEEISIPTTTSQLTNNSNFITSTQASTNYASKDLESSAIQKIYINNTNSYYETSNGTIREYYPTTFVINNVYYPFGDPTVDQAQYNPDLPLNPGLADGEIHPGNLGTPFSENNLEENNNSSNDIILGAGEVPQYAQPNCTGVFDFGKIVQKIVINPTSTIQSSAGAVLVKGGTTINPYNISGTLVLRLKSINGQNIFKSTGDTGEITTVTQTDIDNTFNNTYTYLFAYSQPNNGSDSNKVKYSVFHEGNTYYSVYSGINQLKARLDSINLSNYIASDDARIENWDSAYEDVDTLSSTVSTIETNVSTLTANYTTLSNNIDKILTDNPIPWNSSESGKYIGYQTGRGSNTTYYGIKKGLYFVNEKVNNEHEYIFKDSSLNGDNNSPEKEYICLTKFENNSYYNYSVKKAIEWLDSNFSNYAKSVKIGTTTIKAENSSIDLSTYIPLNLIRTWNSFVDKVSNSINHILTYMNEPTTSSYYITPATYKFNQSQS